MDIIISFLVSVMASVAGYYICKWLDRNHQTASLKRNPMDWSSMGFHCVSLELFLSWLLLQYNELKFMSILVSQKSYYSNYQEYTYKTTETTPRVLHPEKKKKSGIVPIIIFTIVVLLIIAAFYFYPDLANFSI